MFTAERWIEFYKKHNFRLSEFNCSSLCNGPTCCKELKSKGDSSDALPMLFPGEEIVQQEFNKIVSVKNNFGMWSYYAPDCCEGDYRPVSCRAFPYYPTKVHFRFERCDFTIARIPDLATGVCPLHSSEAVLELMRKFWIEILSDEDNRLAYVLNDDSLFESLLYSVGDKENIYVEETHTVLIKKFISALLL